MQSRYPCPRLAIATSVTIVSGYDNSYLGLLLLHGFPTSLFHKSQEDGKIRTVGDAVTIACLDNYVYLLKLMYCRDVTENDQVREDMSHIILLDEKCVMQCQQDH